jgi:predicted XRE-type DNA-binding protein
MTENPKPFDHSGSSFDSFLDEADLRDEVDAAAIKEVIAWQIAQAMVAQGMTKKAMAERLRTSRSQLDRLLDPQNPNVHLATIARAARAVGKKIKIEMVDV